MAHRIPPALWTALADHLIDRLGGVLEGLGLANVHLIDTRNTLVRAELGTFAESGDWLNEIHPTAAGYAKLADRWQVAAEAVLYRGPRPASRFDQQFNRSDFVEIANS